MFAFLGNYKGNQAPRKHLVYSSITGDEFVIIVTFPTARVGMIYVDYRSNPDGDHVIGQYIKNVKFDHKGSGFINGLFFWSVYNVKTYTFDKGMSRPPYFTAMKDSFVSEGGWTRESWSAQCTKVALGQLANLRNKNTSDFVSFIEADLSGIEWKCVPPPEDYHDF